MKEGEGNGKQGQGQKASASAALALALAGAGGMGGGRLPIHQRADRISADGGGAAKKEGEGEKLK